MRTPPEKIQEVVEEVRQDAKAFIKTIADIAIYGSGVTYNEIWNMSYNERQIFIDAIEEKISATSGKQRSEKL